MNVTIIDIAKRLGVSHSTVSRVINDRPNSFISSGTKKRVLATATKMGYRPNLMARSLQQQKTKAIGIVVTDMSGGYSHRLILGAQEVLEARHGYSTIIELASRSNEKQYKRQMELLLERRVEGLICRPIQGLKGFYEQLVQEGIPLVFICECLDVPGVSWVGLDGATAAWELTEKLIKFGHRRIAFVTVECVFDSPSLRPRLEAYQQTMAAHGLRVSPELLGLARIANPQSTYDATDRLLSLEEPPTAFLVSSDMDAYNVMNRLVQRGYRIPQDVSVAGMGDLDPSGYEMVQLTTVAEDPQRIGQLAAESMLRKINGQSKPAGREYLHGRLIVRRSTGPVPAQRSG